MRRAVVTAVLAGMASIAHAETMICVEEVSGGLKFIDGAWQATKFKVTGTQYVISPNPDVPNQYAVKEIGKAYSSFRCERKVFDGELSDQMVCGGMGYGMIVNFKMLRYTQLYTFGYIEDDRSGENTPYVTGGKCSTINP
ncbi:hypothetical protein [Sinorhizobium sp. GL28]|uniref:hypothetical protein n=1 Tax=Sinorhizobium sp. GL28 TaxID=1358418 RepID=UPI00071DFD9B|nr:hypothetical protein [Sinorhizobium sp. GL28]KSV95408.1 hypothetical protein N184_00250 [Sinorhizobium sp. GL28]